MSFKRKMWMSRVLYCCLTLLIVAGCFLQPVVSYGLREQLWLQVIYPDEIAHHYKILPAKDFGGIMERTVRGVPMIVTDPWQACTKNIDNGKTFAGRVVLVVRGECSFVTKALNVQKHGAIAIVITNNDKDDIDTWIDMSDDSTGRAEEVTIPPFYLLGKDGHKIREALSQSFHGIALVNIPQNVTDVSAISQPKWDLW